MPASLTARLFGFGAAPRAPAFRPEPRWIGDAAAARRMLGGRWRLAGRALSAPAEAGPWRLDAPDPAQQAALHGFDWLADLAAAGTREARRAAQAWTFGWIARHGESEAPGLPWAAEIAGRRVTHWLTHADLILSGEDPALLRSFAGALEAHGRRLRRARAERLEGPARLEAAAGEMNVELALHPGARRRRRAAGAFSAVAAETVDAEGGLVCRRPEALAEALLILAAAARDLAALDLGPDAALAGAVSHAQSALRALRLRDGGLPRFHGGGPGAPGRLDRALALAHPRVAPPRRDAAMGYRRLSAGRATAVVDAAPPPPGPLAHAATLALEFAWGERRLIANCGPGAALGGDWAAACRATAAQSTLTLAGLSSARIAPDARGAGPHPFVSRPQETPCETTEDLDGVWLLASHDGWRESHGLIHARRLFLSPDGKDFRGEDRLDAPDRRAEARCDRAEERAGGPLPFAVRFHLPPGVAETAGEAPGGGVVLALPEGAWRFDAAGGATTLEDSLHFDPAEPAPLPARQIVVAGRVEGRAARIAWSLRRL